MAEPSEELRFERRRGGGPKTAEGRRKSSQNSLKHGCRSTKKLLKGESRRAYNQLWKRWAEEYLPITEVELELVETLVDCAWRLKRAERALRAAEAEWQGAQEAEARREASAQVAVQQRYRTTAENSFYKAMRVLDARKSEEKRSAREQGRDQARDFADFAKWKRMAPAIADRIDKVWEARSKREERTPAEKLFQGQRHERPSEQAPALEQTVRVERVGEETVTTFVPTNEELKAEGQAMLPPPIGVTRSFVFVGGVIPPEYAWAGTPAEDDAERLTEDGVLMGEQCMTVDQWLTVIAEEEARGDGHAGPTGVGNLVPNVVGESEVCECAACVVAREVGYFSKMYRLGTRGLARSVWAQPTRWEAGRHSVVA